MMDNNMEVVAFLHPTANWAHVKFSEIGAHCRKDGPNPIPLITLTSAQAEIERLNKYLSEKLVVEKALRRRAEAAEKESDALREALDSARNLPITDAELVRMNNSAVGTDEVCISSRILLLLVGLAMSTRSALQPLEPKND